MCVCAGRLKRRVPKDTFDNLRNEANKPRVFSGMGFLKISAEDCALWPHYF